MKREVAFAGNRHSSEKFGETWQRGRYRGNLPVTGEDLDRASVIKSGSGTSKKAIFKKEMDFVAEKRNTQRNSNKFKGLTENNTE
jgi:hypothetical protein